MLLNLAIAFQQDPRVLIIDDFGIAFDSETEKDLCNKIKFINKEYGTTIILSTPYDKKIKNFASVLLYLNNGHLSKIRSKQSREKRASAPVRRNRPRRNYKKTKR